MRSNRRSFLLTGAGALVAGVVSRADSPASNQKAPMSPEAALRNLEDGNARFASGRSHCGPQNGRVAQLAGGQAPFATVLACSDSRVPVETVFDREPGDIFVARIAGNFVTPEVLGSIEYATLELKTPLVMVLGHTACGAVTAATQYVANGEKFPENIQLLADAIAPAAKSVRGEHGDWVHNAVAANVRMNVQKLRESIHDAVIVGAVYDLHTGLVKQLT